MSTLKLLDINQYVRENKILEVKNANIFGSSKNSFDSEGLWSEVIFGRIGSKERRSRFGYVEFKLPFINPVVYKMIATFSDKIRYILTEKETYIITKEGNLLLDPEGETGAEFLCNNYRKIKFDSLAKKDKEDVGRFIEDNKDLIFITKYLILPPGGIRDMSSAKKNTKQFTSEINDLYEKLVLHNNQLTIHLNDELMKPIFYKQIQKTLNAIYSWIETRLKGKAGLLRGTLLKKTLDYSCRIIATSDPNIPLGFIGLPWHTILVIFELFFFHDVLKNNPELNKQIKEYLKLPEERSLSYNDLKTFSSNMMKNPDSFEGHLKELLFECANKISNDKDVLVKRDPATSRTSYYAATPIPLRQGRGAVVNVLTCDPLSLDFDGDQLCIEPVLTNEAREQIAKLNPRKSKSVWVNPLKNSDHIYTFNLDIISTIYSATKV